MSHLHDYSRSPLSNTRAALVVAHPGHELMVHGWLEKAQPSVFVLTDGSGRSEQSRLHSTTKILTHARAQRGSIYGRLTDAAGYAAILNHQFDLFIEVAKELTETFVNEQIDLVAGDALEGYNPMHDVCRLVINAAVKVARAVTGHDIANLEFSLVNQPAVCPNAPCEGEIWFNLDETAFARKISAARSYAELAGEVRTVLGRTSVSAFKVECLRAVNPGAAVPGYNEERPFYEQYGEQQVAGGHYHRVLRRDEHIAPLAKALMSYAECER